MASRKTLNAENLSTLGAERLAQLLMELSKGNADGQRRLRMELAASVSPSDLAAEITKRLATIARSKGKLDWRKKKKLAAELEAQRQSIVGTLGKQLPAGGLELLWKLLDLAPGVYQRCRGDAVDLTEVFDRALEDLPALAVDANPEALAERLFTALSRHNTGPFGGQYDGALPKLSDALGEAGLAHLHNRVEELPASRARASLLAQIADVSGDIDGYLAHLPQPDAPASILAAAQRLLDAQRPLEALEWLDRLPGKFTSEAGEVTRIATLEALGRQDDAQKRRLACFQVSLIPEFLRSYLKRLPDFDDEVAEDERLDALFSHRNAQGVLALFIEWPSLRRAADLVRVRAGEIDGEDYLLLAPAAEALESEDALAASLLYRRMIEDTLENRRTNRHRHAADHMNRCAELDGWIDDWGVRDNHRQFAERLHQRHQNSVAFWNRVIRD